MLLSLSLLLVCLLLGLLSHLLVIIFTRAWTLYLALYKSYLWQLTLHHWLIVDMKLNGFVNNNKAWWTTPLTNRALKEDQRSKISVGGNVFRKVAMYSSMLAFHRRFISCVYCCACDSCVHDYCWLCMHCWCLWYVQNIIQSGSFNWILNVAAIFFHRCFLV